MGASGRAPEATGGAPPAGGVVGQIPLLRRSGGGQNHDGRAHGGNQGISGLHVFSFVVRAAGLASGVRRPRREDSADISLAVVHRWREQRASASKTVATRPSMPRASIGTNSTIPHTVARENAAEIENAYLAG